MKQNAFYHRAYLILGGEDNDQTHTHIYIHKYREKYKYTIGTIYTNVYIQTHAHTMERSCEVLWRKITQGKGDGEGYRSVVLFNIVCEGRPIW